MRKTAIGSIARTPHLRLVGNYGAGAVDFVNCEARKVRKERKCDPLQAFRNDVILVNPAQ